MEGTPVVLHKVVKGKVEYRYDPLTGQQTRINPDRARRVKQGEVDSGFAQVIASSQERCPFCPERILSAVPRFEGIGEDGRIKVNQTLIFPNLSPFGENHAVGVISDSHFLGMEDFAASLLKDAFVASQSYVQAASKKAGYPKAYPIVVWNYLPPSAGSIIHPHVQIIVEDEPVPELQKIISKAENYFATTKRNYFDDLVKTEKLQGERFVAENESVVALTSFAPRGANEVQIIFPGVASFSDLSEKHISDFVDMLVKLLKGYNSVGVASFNLASYSAQSAASAEAYWLSFKLFSRPAPKGVYTNDTGPMERMYESFVIDFPPEPLAKDLQEAMQAK